VDVKLSVPNPPDYLKTDMTLSVDIETARKPAALVVPLDSVRDTATRPWVLVAKDGRAERRDVTLGLKGGSVAEVLTGVPEGELVVRDPAVQPGARVRVAKEKGK
jgi:HlyD family secretion protein